MHWCAPSFSLLLSVVHFTTSLSSSSSASRWWGVVARDLSCPYIYSPCGWAGAARDLAGLSFASFRHSPSHRLLFFLLPSSCCSSNFKRFSVACSSVVGGLLALEGTYNRGQEKKLVGMGVGQRRLRRHSRVWSTKRTVEVYPSPALREYNHPIEKDEYSKRSFQLLVRELFMLMYQNQGVGLAAPQVGINKQLMVVNVAPDCAPSEERVYCNASTVESSVDKVSLDEGCISFPGVFLSIVRPTRVFVEYFTAQGDKRREWLAEWPSRVFQHELDHLRGILFTDRIGESQRNAIRHLLMGPSNEEKIREAGASS
eukprot:GHVS01067618.1.p1 GENE.GHVS01067618.1~~GHVS01067618.1.p1  ORF type:complete len:314 (-),score=53.85 GHVS01067618.1:128-1069(-)